MITTNGTYLGRLKVRDIYFNLSLNENIKNGEKFNNFLYKVSKLVFPELNNKNKISSLKEGVYLIEFLNNGFKNYILFQKANYLNIEVLSVYMSSKENYRKEFNNENIKKIELDYDISILERDREIKKNNNKITDIYKNDTKFALYRTDHLKDSRTLTSKSRDYHYTNEMYEKIIKEAVSNQELLNYNNKGKVAIIFKREEKYAGVLVAVEHGSKIVIITTLDKKFDVYVRMGIFPDEKNKIYMDNFDISKY